MKYYVGIGNEEFNTMRHYMELYHDIEDFGDGDVDFYAYFTVVDDEVVDLDRRIDRLTVYGMLMERGDRQATPVTVVFRASECSKCPPYRSERICVKNGQRARQKGRPTYRALVEGRVSLTEVLHSLCWDGYEGFDKWEIQKKPDLRFRLYVEVAVSDGGELRWLRRE